MPDHPFARTCLPAQQQAGQLSSSEVEMGVMFPRRTQPSMNGNISPSTQLSRLICKLP